MLCYQTLTSDCALLDSTSHIEKVQRQRISGVEINFAFAATVIHNHHLRDFQAVLE